MLDEELKINNAPEIKVSKKISFIASIKARNILKKEEYEDKDFKETLLIDEVLEAEDE